MERWYTYLQHLFQIFTRAQLTSCIWLYLSITCFSSLLCNSPVAKQRMETWKVFFNTLWEAMQLWLPWHDSSSGFPLDPLQIKLSAMQSNQWSEGQDKPLGTVLTGFKMFPLSSKFPGQTDCSGHYVFWGIKEEWRPLLGLSKFKSGADFANNFVMVQGPSSWPARWEWTWGGKEKST